MLGSAKLMAFVAIQDETKATDFYGGALGLRKISADSFAIEFDSGGVILRASFVKELTAAPFTILGWQVDGIADVVRALTAKGAVFERYGFLEQDELGIWSSGKSEVGWFKDLFGNLRSVSEYR